MDSELGRDRLSARGGNPMVGSNRLRRTVDPERDNQVPQSPAFVPEGYLTRLKERNAAQFLKSLNFRINILSRRQNHLNMISYRY